MDIQIFHDSITLLVNQGLSFMVGAFMALAFAIAAS